MRLRLHTMLGALIPAGALLVANVWAFWAFYHPQTCFDCGVRIGVPFAFWRSGTFQGGEGLLVTGLSGDIVVVALLGTVGGMVGRYVARRRIS